MHFALRTSHILYSMLRATCDKLLAPGSILYPPSSIPSSPISDLLLLSHIAYIPARAAKAQACSQKTHKNRPYVP